MRSDFISDPLNETDIRALRYVRNTNGGATRAIFVEDHEPIGGLLWRKLAAHGLVTERDGPGGVIILTPLGLEKWKEFNT